MLIFVKMLFKIKQIILEKPSENSFVIAKKTRIWVVYITHFKNLIYPKPM